MKSTRERILQTLLLRPNSTISDLAQAVEINNISVRHHLTSLQAGGLVQAQEERHGVGRPRLVYALTDSGAELFPTHYVRLINQLFIQLKNRLSKEEFEKILVQIAVEISKEHSNRIQNLPFDEKLSSIQQFLASEGFVIEWEKQGTEIKINEMSCPFFHISLNHPEVCTIDRTIFATLLSTPVEKVKCVLTGDNQCVFVFNQDSVKEGMK